jgi:hypothetical protein
MPGRALRVNCLACVPSILRLSYQYLSFVVSPSLHHYSSLSQPYKLTAIVRPPLEGKHEARRQFVPLLRGHSPQALKALLGRIRAVGVSAILCCRRLTQNGHMGYEETCYIPLTLEVGSKDSHKRLSAH